jgi:hypothetical protein
VIMQDRRSTTLDDSSRSTTVSPSLGMASADGSDQHRLDA